MFIHTRGYKGYRVSDPLFCCYEQIKKGCRPGNLCRKKDYVNLMRCEIKSNGTEKPTFQRNCSHSKEGSNFLITELETKNMKLISISNRCFAGKGP